MPGAMLTPGVSSHQTHAPADPHARRVLVFSDRPVIGRGLVALLPESLRAGATRHAELALAARALERASALAIIDAGSLGALACAEQAAAAGVPRLVLLSRRDAAKTPALASASGALLTEELDRELLELAIGAVLRGMRIFPDGILPPGVAPAARSRPGGDRMDLALALVAAGCRDAEIAAELSLSESAARKLVQRAVARLGARTRCEAIVKAIGRGELQ